MIPLRRLGARWGLLVTAVTLAGLTVFAAARHLAEWSSTRRVAGLRLIAPADVEVDLRESIAHPTRLESAGVNFADGWSRAGKWGLWAMEGSATIELLLDRPRTRTLTLDCRAHPGLDGVAEQEVSFALNDTALGRQPLGRTWQQLTVRLPAPAQRAGVNRLELGFAAAVAPTSSDPASGVRRLAIGVRGLSLRGAGLGGIAVWPLSEAEGPGEVATQGQSKRVWLGASGTLVAPLELEPGARWLEVSARRPAALANAPAVIRPIAVTGAGRELRPPSLALDAGARQGRQRYPLDTLGDGLVTAWFEVETVGQLGVALRTLGGGVDPPGQPAADAGSSPPNIVLLILDAARPDHFGCYGYRRDTTPAIDRLAHESQVFQRVFALAPYTLCSVPTIATGTSWLRHGVNYHEDRLAAGAVTLAEVLRDLGYHTAGFSATPNNSRAKGFDQGFELFFESWVDSGQNRESIDPFLLVRQAIFWLDQVDRSRPYFLMVHMVPPHEPYAPGPRFDVFSDPSYDGPVDGRFPVLHAMQDGAIEWTANDLQHVIDLYDGNLRRADAATRELLARLEDDPEWPQTVVLVTSDHGEAMFEHGYATHNSTVYDEMLAVPFVLRLPPTMRPRPIDLDQLATLADLSPTLAGLAGASLPPPLDGLDLLSPRQEVDNRFFLARTTGKPPLYGLRTGRYKAVLSQCNAGGLYDLDQDPTERVNLMLDRFPLFAGFEATATKLLNAPQPAVVPERSDALSASEVELLRELGYLR